MDFTFGICATKENSDFHEVIIDSILSQNIPNVEIIFIGESCPNHPSIKFIYFDESIREGWITKKKNTITKFSSNENIVFMHDYIQFLPGWYNEFLKFGNDFEVCMNRIQNLDGRRNLDWILYYQDLQFNNAEQLVPYDKEFSKLMYIPGFYWVAKKQFMQNHPLNENLIWGMAEDVEWSKRIREEIVFKINQHSVVQFLKQKEYTLNEISPDNIFTLELYYKERTQND